MLNLNILALVYSDSYLKFISSNMVGRAGHDNIAHTSQTVRIGIMHNNAISGQMEVNLFNHFMFVIGRM